MITVTITTSMEFLTRHDLEQFLESDDANAVLGFPNEVRTAQQTGKPFVFKTQRPEFGAVVRSDIVVTEK